MKILVIEDDAAVRYALSEMLEIHGHSVLRADNGTDGVSLAEEKPDFIFCDIGLPGLSGYDVLNSIREMPGCADAPFVFLTAYSDREAQRRGMASGADDYITKPFGESEIMDCIRARVRRQRSVHERMEALISERREEMTAEWAHELMTPLTVVICGLELLESDSTAANPAEVKTLVSLMHAAALRQEWLSRKLIQYFKFERMRHGIDEFEIASCDAAEAVSIAAQRAARADGRLADVSLCCEHCEVRIGAGFLNVALAEVVENALRFSLPGSPVRVRGLATPQTYRIEVSDSGPGMTSEQRSGVGAFRQFDRTIHEQQGLGLGLAIVRAVMFLARGRLLLEDNPGGSGLCAVLEVPLAGR